MSDFLTPDHPDAFVDFSRKEPLYDYIVECPKCRGYGGWNLSLNSYSLHGRPDTPENRHRYRHFTCACSHCYGHGYVTEAIAAKCSGHEWVRTMNLGRCYNRYECVHCGQINDVDSSD
jgi:DnaJ-class molecular chaperone